jgi:hypothetical protein
MSIPEIIFDENNDKSSHKNGKMRFEISKSWNRLVILGSQLGREKHLNYSKPAFHPRPCLLSQNY